MLPLRERLVRERLKCEALTRSRRGERSCVIAESLGISRKTLYNWLRIARTHTAPQRNPASGVSPCEWTYAEALARVERGLARMRLGLPYHPGGR